MYSAEVNYSSIVRFYNEIFVKILEIQFCVNCVVHNRPQGSGRALKLGGKKDVESFVDQLKSEGERKYRLGVMKL